MEDIDIRVLHHIGRYTITLRRVLQTQLFDGKNPQSVLTRLERGGYIQRIERGLAGNFSYYQLGKKGAAAIGLSENKAKAKAVKGLAQDLGALWFSCMEDKLRKRLLDPELRTLFGSQKGGNIIYVAQADDEPTVFRLFIPDATAKLDRYVTALKRSAHQVCDDERLIRWAERGTYQFAVLLPNEGRKDLLAELIRGEDFPDVRIHLAIAPGPEDLSLFISPEKETPAS